MKKYWLYLKYILKHKWYVFEYSLKYGVPIQGILHDFSKFLPDEFFPYANYFYGKNKTAKVDYDFNVAWLKHIHRNKHHWQYWILKNDDGSEEYLTMPDKYFLEMICDWHGAGLAIVNSDNISSWFNKNKDNIKVEWETMEVLDLYINEDRGLMTPYGYVYLKHMLKTT